MKLLTDSAKVQTWYRKPLEGRASSNGKPYAITLKKGTVNKLLVNFFGGGFSWNKETAARPMTLSRIAGNKEWFYVPHLPNIQLNSIHIGLLSAKDKRNPFYDWNILGIPYTTADFHIGDSEFEYQNAKGERKILYHNGIKNVEAALDVMKGYFSETPDALVIAGQSAGGFGCVANCPKIANIYPDCENIVVYSEGSHLRSPVLQETARSVWKANSDLTSHLNSNDLIADLFNYAQDNMPAHTLFLHSNSIWDKALVEFMYKMNHGKLEVNNQALNEFHQSLLDVTKRLKSEIRNYNFYLTDYDKKDKSGTTPHIFSGNPKLIYGKMQDGVSLAEWLCRAISGKPTNVGEVFLQK
ncbi:MAG: pectinacetylesterase family protein [Defluviitaleaceae bacterium]|nr:pectinacetylesterase family protein [Defluviitaleaceae bacterium]